MRYTKPAVSFSDQIDILRGRGLIIGDDKLAERYLSNISYYRLRAYTYPYQNNKVAEHPFKHGISFDDVIALYTFDRKLRLLVFDAIEKIEIAVRTQIIYQWALTNGSHWHLEPHLFLNPHKHAENLASLEAEIDRSKETFIDHYKNKYTNPPQPPAWMSLEVTSIGLLSKFFKLLKRGSQKKKVIQHFGVYDIQLFETWLKSFSEIRNICAHHGRLWNRRMTTHIEFPTNPIYPFIKNTSILPYKIYAALSCMTYILDIINPESTFKSRVVELIHNCPKGQLKEMGVPKNWEEDDFWKVDLSGKEEDN